MLFWPYGSPGHHPLSPRSGSRRPWQARTLLSQASSGPLSQIQPHLQGAVGKQAQGQSTLEPPNPGVSLCFAGETPPPCLPHQGRASANHHRDLPPNLSRGTGPSICLRGETGDDSRRETVPDWQKHLVAAVPASLPRALALGTATGHPPTGASSPTLRQTHFGSLKQTCLKELTNTVERHSPHPTVKICVLTGHSALTLRKEPQPWDGPAAFPGPVTTAACGFSAALPRPAC